MEHNDLTIRPISGREDLALFNRLPYVLNDEIANDMAAGRRRPEWTWIALRGDRLVARAGWWSRPGDSEPSCLDIFDFDDDDPNGRTVGRQLLERAMGEVVGRDAQVPQYLRFVPPDWRDHEATVHPVADRMTVLEQLGARLLVERLRLEWRPGTPVAEPGGRLTFRPVDDIGELLDLMTLALDGTLDAPSLLDLQTMTARQAAAHHFDDELDRYRSPREWWRIAVAPDGGPVGFVVPAHNGYQPIIAYIGVVPGHRGNGYIDDILSEGTRILTATEVPRIRASTDLANVPMAEAFARAGWVNFERSIDMTWPPPPPS